jgi:ribose transport system ATP-binding protein
VLAGVYSRDGGEILFRGEPVDSAAALRRGNEQPIAFIHQDLGLVEWMTVAENMALVMGFPRRFGLIDWAATRRQAQKRWKISAFSLIRMTACSTSPALKNRCWQ